MNYLVTSQKDESAVRSKSHFIRSILFKHAHVYKIQSKKKNTGCILLKLIQVVST